MDQTEGISRDRVVRVGTRVIQAVAVNLLSAIPIVGPSLKVGTETFLKEIRSTSGETLEPDERKVLDWISKLTPEEYHTIVLAVLENSEVAIPEELRADLFRNMEQSRYDLSTAISSANSDEFSRKKILNEFLQFSGKFEQTDSEPPSIEDWKKAASYQVRLRQWESVVALMPKLYAQEPVDPDVVELDRIATRNFDWSSHVNSRAAAIVIFMCPLLLGTFVGNLLVKVGAIHVAAWLSWTLVAVGFVGGPAYFAAGPWLLSKTTYPTRHKMAQACYVATFITVVLFGIGEAVGWINGS